MRYGILVLTTLGLAGVLLMAGCGGSTSGPAAAPATPDPTRSAVTVTQSPTLEQVKATLAKLGKDLPDFLAGGTQVAPPVAPAGEVSPASYMTVLALSRWVYGWNVAARRTQWYECNLTSWSNLTDVYVRDRGGDPDLYVFSPLRPGIPNSSLKLIGYSAGNRDEQVGSFITRDWGGPGRFVIAVYGYTWGQYDLKIW